MEKSLSVQTAIREALVEEMTENEKIIYMGEDASFGGVRGITRGFADLFGTNRVIDTPISEAAFLGAGVGIALKGFIPVLDLRLSSFLLVAYDQIVHCAAQMRYLCGGSVNIPMVIWCANGGRRGMGPHHSESLESLFMGIPGIKIVVPSGPNTAKALFKSSINDPNPVMLFEPLGISALDDEKENNEIIELGKGKLVRQGSHITVITYGFGVSIALDAADYFKQKGLEVEIIDLLTLQPLDTEIILNAARKNGRIIVLEDGWKTAGVGAEVCAIIAEHAPGTFVKRVAGEDVPIPASLELEKRVLPQKEDLIKAIDELVG